MTPRETIALAYKSGAHGHGDTFESDERAHARLGYVLDTPEYFFMWRRCGLTWDFEMLRNPSLVEPDSVFVWIWACAGNFRKAVSAALEITPDVAFAGYDRRGLPRFVDVRRVLVRE